MIYHVMEITTYIISAFGVIGGTAFIFALPFAKKILNYLTEKYVDIKLNKELENHKNKLQKQLEDHRKETHKSIEEHKKELERFAFIHQTQFSTLHKERAEIIKELYQLLVRYRTYIDINYRDNKKLTVDEFEKEKIIEIAGNFYSKYVYNKIYLTEELCKKIEQTELIMRNTMKESIYLIAKNNDTNPENQKFIETKDFKDFEQSIGITIKTKIIPLEKELINEFRKMLGVEDTPIKS